MDFAVGRPALGPLPPEGHRCGGTPLGFLNSAHMVKWLGCALCEFNRTVYQKSKTNLRFGTPTQRSIVVNLCFFSSISTIGAEFSSVSRFSENVSMGGASTEIMHNLVFYFAA